MPEVPSLESNCTALGTIWPRDSVRDAHLRAAISAIAAERHAALQTLWRYDLGFILDRLIDQHSMPVAIIEEAIIEYRKYMTLLLAGERRPLMFSREVDEVWHAHILFTRRYAQFCQDIFGRFIHHDPITRSAALAEHHTTSRAQFSHAYRELFGEPSYLWL